MRQWLCGIALLCADPARAQDVSAIAHRPPSSPTVQLGKARFSLPVADYQSVDGSWHRSHGVIVDRQITPNANLALGLFKSGPKRGEMPAAEMPGKSHKLSLRLSYSF
jgi:hypothetical protein